MPATLFITGGAGFIGSSFARLAAAQHYQLIILDALTYAGHKENLEGVGAKLIEGNILDKPLVSKLFEEYRPQALLHFAAESHVDNSITSPRDFMDTNIIGTYTLLEAARAWLAAQHESVVSRFRYMQISTDEVFGALGEEGAFSELSPYAPNSPYSASKAAADHLARAWGHTYGLPVIITHCSNNYGPRQLPEKLIPVIITRALSGEKLPVYGDGQQVRDWIHVEDHCRGILLALEKGRIGEHYCFGGRTEIKNLDLVNLICSILDNICPRIAGGSYREQIAFVTDRPGHDRRYAIDDSKAEKELEFTRHWEFAAGLRATVQWYLDNIAWCKLVARKKAA